MLMPISCYPAVVFSFPSVNYINHPCQNQPNLGSTGLGDMTEILFENGVKHLRNNSKSGTAYNRIHVVDTWMYSTIWT